MIKDVIIVDRIVPPEAWGVLCIDVWDNDGGNDVFYQNVVSHLSQYKIDAVVNCTLDQRIDYSNHSIFNTFKKYVWNRDEKNPDHILQLFRDDLIKSSGQRPVSRILNAELFGDHTYSLNSCRTFEHHVQSYYSHITDWILIGSAWKICLHAGPLGINNILNTLISHKFHIFPDWSIQNEDQTPVTRQQVEDDEYIWASVGDDGYRLVSKIGGVWTRK